MCFNISDSDTLMLLTLGNGTCRRLRRHRLAMHGLSISVLPTLGSGTSARFILALRLLAKTRTRALPRFSTQGLLTWAKGILTSTILGWRFLVLTLLAPRESATGLSEFAGDVDHDC